MERGQNVLWQWAIASWLVGGTQRGQGLTICPLALALAQWLPDAPPAPPGWPLLLFLHSPALPFFMVPLCVLWDHFLPLPISLTPAHSCLAEDANVPGCLWPPTPVCGGGGGGLGWRMEEFEC
jgi:hypothetical protein